MRERYSQILGVAPNASVEQVKKAYRKRAKELHPDVAKTSDASKKFLEIKKAYEYLTSNHWIEEKLSSPKYDYSPSPPPPTDTEHHAWWVKETKRRAEEYKKTKTNKPPPKEYVDYQKRLDFYSLLLKSLLLSVILITFPIALIQLNLEDSAEQEMNKYLVPALLGVDVICMALFLYAVGLKYIPKKNKA